MAYTLEQFCRDCHDALAADPGPQGREKVRLQLEALLRDRDFVAACCGPEQEPGVNTLYEDPELGFMVLAHIGREGRKSPPHDHGASWAIYGQATEYTDMTVFDRTRESADGRVEVRPARQFRLEPGMAGLFDVGTIHAIDYPARARYVRVTGTDLDKISRKRYDLESGATAEFGPTPRA